MNNMEKLMSYSTLNCDVNNYVCRIALNRPERMNAVNEELYTELQSALKDAENNDDVRVVVITGSVRVKDGVKKQAFCAGADLKKHSAGERTRAQKRQYIELAHKTTEMIYKYPKPVIAAVNGPARGAGAELALCCDLILMSEEGSIGFPETGLGTFVGGGVTMHLSRITGVMKAKELIYTGRILKGMDAVDAGLALECYPSSDFYNNVDEFALTIAEKAPYSIYLAKKQIQLSSSLDIETVLQLETDAILSCMDTKDWKEGLDAFAEKRKPVYKGW